MKHAKIRTCMIARCIVFCMMCSQLFSIMSYAENSFTTLRVGEQSIQLAVQPSETDLGIMIGAEEITEAFGMSYTFDATAGSFTITDQSYGTVAFMHNATTYSMNGSTHNCQPYFYVSNTIPMIELGFFCDIFGISYQYDEANNTIYADRSTVYADRSTKNLNGTLSVDATAKISSNGLNVTLYLEDATSIYHENLINETHVLGTLHLTQSAPNGSFSYNTKGLVPEAQYYSLLYRVNDAQDSVVATGFVNTNGGIQGVELLNQHYGNPMRFSADEISNVNICIPAFAYQSCGTDSYWTFDATTGTLDIKGTGSVTDNGWKLLSEYITTVKVDPGISAFSTQMPMKLQQLYLPDTITEIGDRAFAYCDELSSVTYSGSETEWDAVSVGNDNDSLTSATINCLDSNSVSVIYYNNGGSDSPESKEVTKNASVTISSVEPVREGFDFLGWATSPTATTAQYRSGASVNVGSSHLKLYAVWDDAQVSTGSCGTNLTWSYYNNGLLKITGSGEMYDYEDLKDIPWYSIRENVTTVSLSNQITKIGDYAFYNFNNLTSITIPNSVTSIGDYAFGYCKSLTNITIPNSVTSIGDYAFGYCKSLSNISISEGVTSIGASAFEDCHSLTNITIPNSVKSIGGYAFRYCNNLTSITMSNSVTSIGASAFEDCHNLTNITIPSSVTSIGDYAFEDCHNLTNITISEGVTSIGIYAFYNCDKLTQITIPGSVTSIGKYAFNDCNTLANVEILNGNGGTSIGDYVFDGCSSLTQITIPGSVTSIGKYAFNGCKALANVEILNGNGGTSIGDYAFQKLSKLTQITIPGSVTSIGNYAFFDCQYLAKVDILNGNGGTSIGNYAFQNCYRLASITIPNSVTSIGEHAFYNCSGLTSITIPNSVTSIGGYAFRGCSRLVSITIPDSVTTINVSTFYNCSKLASIAIPNSVTSFGNYVFAGCSILTDIYYSGTQDEWNMITKANGFSVPTNATIHYNSHIDVKSTNCSYDGQNIVAKIDFNYVLKDTIAYLAIYDTDYSLLKLGSADIASGDTTATITIPTDTNYTGYSYKIMLWNPTNLAPYTDFIDGTIRKN